jgi:predicted AAA+ superfamily ATPase
MDLPAEQSAFLWGARQTGKSHYLRQHFPQAIFYDLLDTRESTRLTINPHLLREEIEQQYRAGNRQRVIIDEIEIVPALLNEVHWLIENIGASFILCSSSARKLKTQSTNLLGGRAWLYHFYPLVFPEIPDFNLTRALQQGLLPKLYLSDPKYVREHLQAYVDVYLTDEIRNEGLVRNLPAFARFLDVVGLTNSEMVNMSNIARDCGVNRNVIKQFYQILVDTLLGYFIYPYQKKVKRDIVASTPKFYLFDVGVANYLAHREIKILKGTEAGKSFEHYILMELMAYRNMQRKTFEITYWRTKTGLEVDFILGDAKLAIEVKMSEQVHQQDLKGLIAFCEEHHPKNAIVVSQDPRARYLKVNEQCEITILPWQEFLQKLWTGEWPF